MLYAPEKLILPCMYIHVATMELHARLIKLMHAQSNHTINS